MKLASKKHKKIDPRQMHKDYLGHIEGSLEKQGVMFFDDKVVDINEDYLRLPPEITEISSRDLGEYLNAFTQQRVYMRTILGRVEILEEEARRAYFHVANTQYKQLSSQRLSETAKDRIINSDEEVAELYEDYMDAKQKVRTVQYAIQNAEDVCFLLSREVTRRNGDIENENRAGGVRYR